MESRLPVRTRLKLVSSTWFLIKQLPQCFQDFKKIIAFSFALAVLVFHPENLWPPPHQFLSLASFRADGQCAIRFRIVYGGILSYEMSRERENCERKQSGRWLAARRSDFEHSLAFDHAGKIESRRRETNCFAGTQPASQSSLNFSQRSHFAILKAPIRN